MTAKPYHDRAVLACAVVIVSTPLLFGTAACAGRRASGPETSNAIASRERPRGTSAVLGGDELRKAPGSNALEIIQELRPLFLLKHRGQPGPIVFVDDAPRGGTETLREIPALDVVEIRYIDAVSATQLYGSGHAGGVIYVVTGERPFRDD